MKGSRQWHFLIASVALFFSVACYIATPEPTANLELIATATEKSPVTPYATVRATVTPTPKNATVNALRALWVREASGHTSPISGILDSGTSVELLSECDEIGWREIKSGTLTGWVNADYLSGGCE